MATATGQLTRSTTNRRVAGIAGGIAEHYGWDPTLVRLGFAAALFMGWGLPLYVVLWIVLPQGPASTPAIRIAEERFAQGEIDGAELDRIRRDLAAHP